LIVSFLNKGISMGLIAWRAMVLIIQHFWDRILHSNTSCCNEYRLSDLKSTVEIILLCKTAFVIWTIRFSMNSWDMLRWKTMWNSGPTFSFKLGVEEKGNTQKPPKISFLVIIEAKFYKPLILLQTTLMLIMKMIIMLLKQNIPKVNTKILNNKNNIL
jgi:hypothetical protein